MKALMTCRDVVREMTEVAEGRITSAERALFHFHMMLCPHCRRYYRQFLSVKEAVGTVTREDLPEDFEEVMEPVLKWLRQNPPANGNHT